jgi:hypothetical protein
MANNPTGVIEVPNYISSLSVVPNPFNNRALVSFYSDKALNMTEKLTDMLGGEVYKRSFEANAGVNSREIERNSLPVGVYFYSITDGKSVYTKRLIIAE